MKPIHLLSATILLLAACKEPQTTATPSSDASSEDKALLETVLNTAPKGEAMAIKADVSDADAIEAAAVAIEEKLGPIDVWVNNAMVSVFSPIKKMTAAEFKRVTEVCYLGCVNGSLAALRRMLPATTQAAIRFMTKPSPAIRRIRTLPEP